MHVAIYGTIALAAFAALLYSFGKDNGWFRSDRVSDRDGLLRKGGRIQ